jgi:glutathione S-transferase
MFAPVAARFATWGVKLDPIAGQYCDAVLALPAMQEWRDAALTEIEVLNF